MSDSPEIQEVTQLRQQLATRDQDVARLERIAYALDTVTRKCERLTLALSYLAQLGGGHSEGNDFAKAALRKEAQP